MFSLDQLQVPLLKQLCQFHGITLPKKAKRNPLTALLRDTGKTDDELIHAMLDANRTANSNKDEESSVDSHDSPPNLLDSRGPSRQETMFNLERSATMKAIENLEQLLSDAQTPSREVKVAVGAVERKLFRMKKSLEDLISATPTEGLQYVMDRADEVEDRAHAAILQADSSEAASSTTPSSGQRPTNLPKLQLPTFEGSPSTFRPFMDQFRALVLDIEDVPDTVKIAHLLNSLRGQAKDFYGNIEPKGENLASLLQSLQEHYGDPSASLLRSVIDIESLKHVSNGDTAGLRRMVATFERNVREVKAAYRELTPESASKGDDLFLCPVLLSKLPTQTSQRWQREHPAPERFLLDKLLEWLKREITIAETAQNTQTGFSNLPALAFHANDKPEPTSSTKCDSSSKRRKCPICNKDSHPLVYCKTFRGMSPQERMKHVQSNQHCRSCFSKKHTHLDQKCETKCCGRHHPLLCTRQTTQPPTQAPLDRASSASVQTGSSVLQTAVTYVGNNKRDPARLARILFDPGSDVSYVTEEFARSLKLDTIRERNAATVVFGGDTHHVKRRLVAAFAQSTETGPVPLMLWTTPCITAPMQPVSLPIEINAFAPFCEDYSAPLRAVDILVGTDQYWTLVKGLVARVGPSLMVVDTIFGRTIHGKVPGGFDCPPHFRTNLVRDRAEDDNVRRMWDLEVMGIRDTELTEDLPTPKRKGQRIEVLLPWKNDERPSSNLPSVSIRQQKMEARLTGEQKSHYKEYLDAYLQGNIVSPVPGPVKPRYLLPHRGIDQKGKLRVVFDGGAPCPNSKSGLNGMLQTGPNLLPNILKVLVNMRMHPVSVQSDIRAAFTQLEVGERDREHLCFIWRGKTFMFNRLPFGLNCSPYLLHEALKFLIEEQSQLFPQTAQALRSALYVDDICGSFADSDSADQFIKETTQIFSSASMELKPWLRSDAAGQTPQSILGVHQSADSLEVCFAPQQPPASWTQRQLVSYVASTFDPLGLVYPYTVGGRILCQKAWEAGKGWDTPLPKTLQGEIEKWCSQTTPDRKATFQRCIGTPAEEIHVFTDASESAYATAIYLRGGGTCHLLLARARVAPLKPKMSIPRLELLAAVLGTKLFVFLKESSEFIASLQPYFWTDNEAVRYWIATEPSKLKRFEANRVKEIRDSTTDRWRRIQTTDNPADLATRPHPPGTCSSDLWLHGPTFLQSRLPVPPVPAINPDESASQALHVQEHVDNPVPPVLPMKSTLRATVRVVALVLHFVKKLRREDPLPLRGTPLLSIPSPLKTEALDLLLRTEQMRFYPTEYRRLQQARALPQGSQLSFSRPTFDEQRRIICTTPRFEGGARLPLLPVQGPLFRLVVLDEHVKLLHSGPMSVVAQIRRSYDVIKAGSRTKRILRTACGPCLRMVGAAYRSTEGTLPAWRTEPCRPFAHTGVDHIGPLRRGNEKVYILLATCATTRAIHLEVQPSLHAAETQRALRRFFSRRGLPQHIRSDRHPTFVANRELVDSWTFSPAHAPWHGGFYERLVGLVKKSLRATLHLTHVSDQEFNTIVTEVEEALNRRPLVNEDGDVLTPAHFLMGLPPPQLEREPPHNVDLRKAWNHRSKIADDVWRRFTHEYLPTLREWRRHRGQSSRTPRLGELVLIKMDQVPRLHWPIARVLEVKPHECTLQHGNRNITRPWEHIHRLEAEPVDDERHVTPATRRTQDDTSRSAPTIARTGRPPTSTERHVQPDQRRTQQGPAPTTTRSGRVSNAPRRYAPS